MTVLLTGASGLLGAATARLLSQQGHRLVSLRRPGTRTDLLGPLADSITWIEGDLTDLASLAQAVEGVEAVVNVAGKVSFAPQDRRALYQTNVEGTRNLVNTLLERNPAARLVHISSIAVLAPKAGEQSVDESGTWDTQSGYTYYGYTKYLGELEVWRAKEEGLRVTVLNPSLILGPGRWHESSTALFNYVREGKTWVTPGWANYVDVRDVAQAIALALEGRGEGQRFILSAGCQPFPAFFAEIAKAMCRPAPHRLLPKALVGLAWRVEALRSLLTGKPPLITAETARNAYRQVEYRGTKAVEGLGVRYTPLLETLAYTLAHLPK